MTLLTPAALSVCHAGNLAVTLSFGGLVARLGLPGTYGMYATANAAAAWLIAARLPETRSSSLHELEQLLVRGAAPRR